MTNVAQTGLQSRPTSLRDEGARWRAESRGGRVKDVERGREGRERPDEPLDDPQVELRHPMDVQVEPGGQAAVERNGSVALESAYALVDGEFVGDSKGVDRGTLYDRQRQSKKMVNASQRMTTTYLDLHNLTTSPRNHENLISMHNIEIYLV
ncbi:hypothetical protein OG21DRAFT_1263500 [Imleria badia]|nr:hypothetical protein OG21DRAFT_1263500 [Imleria badia]